MTKTVSLVNFNGVDIGERFWMNGKVAKLYGPYSGPTGSTLGWRDAKMILNAYAMTLTVEEKQAIVDALKAN